MNTKVDRHTLCVLIARFQVPSLTEAHTELIEEALSNHPRVLILLGVSPTRGTLSNPLDYAARRQMLLERFPHDRYPQLSINYVKDMKSDEAWSKKVDGLIADHLGPNDTAILYGGRDSCIPHYTTKTYPVRELMSSRHISGTEIRRQVSEASRSSPDFRAGMIFATFQRFPTVYSTVDVLPVDRDNKRVLLARKSDETLYRFVGGFADPADDSFEVAAVRELKEEANLEVDEDTLTYIGSARITDWRYAREQDKIITHLYVGDALHTEASANDDIAEVRWFDWEDISAKILVTEHAKLYERFIARIAKHLKWAAPKGTLTIS